MAESTNCHTQRNPPYSSALQLELIELHSSTSVTFDGQGEQAYHKATLPLHRILLAV